jgi:eukaryotic-like serine/threonine-protein kinase
MERIGKYELIRELGAGATSTVYLARDPFADREVAVKLISPEVLTDSERGRAFQHLLRNEASLAGKLVHPHIVQIYDAVIAAEQSYIVMEYVDGGTLEPYCMPSHQLPLERLVEIIFKCTRALDYAFQLGITHRDIKPANILLAADDGSGRSDIKISDFGAAIQAANDTTQVSGVGSPAYMSPQQVREQPLDHRTDIWSLGVVMYQLLTGQLPFKATSNYGMIYQICNAAAPPPSSFRPDVPPVLDAVVAKALQRDLDARYANWGDFSHDLAQAFRNRRLAVRRPDFPDSEKFESLRGLAFFKEFSDVEIWEVVRFSRWDEVVPGTAIMKDGEAGDSFCFLTEGELQVAKNGRTLNQLAPGDCFGEMAVIGTQRHRGADVIAAGPAKVVTVPGEAFRKASDACRMHFYQAFLLVLANRLGQANIRLAQA